jgi:transcriptional regulator with XRE-family HTH domain
MTAATLGERVIAARTARRMTTTALQRASGLSARTIRDIEHGHPTRRYSSTTLASLDEALGWPRGEAWRVWRTSDIDVAETVRDEIAEQMAALRAQIVEVSERPPWSVEIVDLMRLMSPADRRLLLDLASRLAPG